MTSVKPVLGFILLRLYSGPTTMPPPGLVVVTTSMAYVGAEVANGIERDGSGRLPCARVGEPALHESIIVSAAGMLLDNNGQAALPAYPDTAARALYRRTTCVSH